jgi:hypothetical protein
VLGVGAVAELDRAVSAGLAEEAGTQDEDALRARDRDPRAEAELRRILTEPFGVDRQVAAELRVGESRRDRRAHELLRADAVVAQRVDELRGDREQREPIGIESCHRGEL